jgi:restriction system-associated AAA family ATPase
MQLLHVKLLTKFRGLSAGSEFRFDNTQPIEGRIEPVCLVGLNGSGKSNLLELICEIFYYLETYVLAEGKPAKKFQTGFGFEISYMLDVSSLQNVLNLVKIDSLLKDYRNTIVNISKQPKELPQITLTPNYNKDLDKTTDFEYFLLPNHIIAYSSGQNELISNPFIKSSYNYFSILEKKQAKDINLELGLPRLFHLDYDSSQLATISNYLFSEHNEVSLLTHELKLDKDEPLDSFSIVIRFNNYRNNKIVYPRTLQIAIDNLKSCATAIEETKKGDDVIKLKLAFFVNPELRRAFQRKFGSAILLFRDLFYLNLMNIHLHEVTARNQIKDAPSMTYDNLAHLVPVPSRDKLIFDLQKVRFRKKREIEPIKYKNLSDGEHQLMHVLGSLMLLNTSGSILLYDEPETHFNPEWRSQLISLINKATKEKVKTDKIRKQEILITSHSPFIVSDCRRERVFIFDKGKASNPKINTFGTSVNILTDEVFKKSESISQIPIDKIDEIKALPLNTLEQIQAAKEASRVLGESVEKVLLFRELLMREEKLKTSND